MPSRDSYRDKPLSKRETCAHCGGSVVTVKTYDGTERECLSCGRKPGYVAPVADGKPEMKPVTTWPGVEHPQQKAG